MTSKYMVSMTGLLATIALAFSLSSLVSSQPTIEETDCPRIRKAWHLMSSDERQLVKEGLLDLRDSDDPAADKLTTIAAVHADWFYTGLVHVSSANYFWHGYLVWEVETQIRAIDPVKYGCWAMPYYDYTIDVGHESEASIFSGELGGVGDPDNDYAVNDYSWSHVSPSDWYVHTTQADSQCCAATGDSLPLCSIKRRQTDEADNGKYFVSAQELGRFFTEPSWRTFDTFSHSYPLDSVMAFMRSPDTADNPSNSQSDFGVDDGLSCMCTTACGSSEGYDPVWWLLHSFAQYHFSLWMNCADNGYTSAAALQDNSRAFQSGFQEERVAALIAEAEARDPTLDVNDFQFGLDNKLYFPGISDKEWSYTHLNQLTVRQLYDIGQWNVQYDVGTFYYEAGVDQVCHSKLNPEWFTGTRTGTEQKKTKKTKKTKNKRGGIFHGIDLHFNKSGSYLNVITFVVVIAMVLGIYLVRRFFFNAKKIQILNSDRSPAAFYGSL